MNVMKLDAVKILIWQTIRDTLKDKGIEIEDTDKGTIWRKSR